MSKYDLSVLVPSRNEMFLKNTIDSILETIEANTEIIAVLDGEWPTEPIPDHPRVTLIKLGKSIGQRAATNLACKLSSAKYVMKCDAHCKFGKGFDRIMIEDMQPDWTMVLAMHNLHAFDWVCECGHRRYQGPTAPCEKCGKEMTREMLWREKPSPYTTAMRFDSDLKFQYWSEYKKRQSGDLVETMSLLGACWMLTRERYWELNICDESWGSWGNQGTEVSAKTHLSGGKVICSKKTWFAHLFRTQGGDFGFPYQISGRQVDHARKSSRHMFYNNTFEKQIHPLSWLLEKFKPIPGWHDESGKERLQSVMEAGDQFYRKQKSNIPIETSQIESPEPVSSLGVLSKSIVYYTDNRLKIAIANRCRKNLLQVGLPIVNVSLKPMNGDFGQNIYLPLERGHLTMFKQILAGLEASTADIVFLCEHDVLYHPSHFDFIPPKKDVYYYNVAVWKVDWETGQALKVDDCRQTSGLCAYRELLVDHYRKRVALVEANGYSNAMGFEPGTHNRKERVDDFKSETWQSAYPNIDIRHDNNLTPTRWKKEQFRNQKFTQGWTEGKIELWGMMNAIR